MGGACPGGLLRNTSNLPKDPLRPALVLLPPLPYNTTSSIPNETTTACSATTITPTTRVCRKISSGDDDVVSCRNEAKTET